jgi:hypothetical protein
MRNLIICTCIILINGCTNGYLLKGKTEVLYSIKIPNKNYTLNVVYLPSNATIQSAIQVRKQFKDKGEVINTYERYNYMDTCELINDTTFMLVIRDTVSVLGNKPDTMRIIIK